MTSETERIGGRAWWSALGVWILVIASIVSWRRGVLFDGGLDIVVVLKALVALIALSLAAVIVATTRRRRRAVGGFSLALVSAIVAVSIVGAYASGDLSSALTLAARIAILSATILCLIAAHSTTAVISTLLAAMTGVGLFAAITGTPTLVTEGRLFGGIPPLAPNELAVLLLPPMVGFFYLMVVTGVRWWSASLFLALLIATYLTGSRTGLAAAIFALVLVLLLSDRVSRGVVCGALLIIPIGFAAVSFTDLVNDLVSRGEDPASLLTLNARTVAWEAVLSTPFDSWRWWVGAGLALKVVPVDERFRDEQVLDSSWISALAQSGVLGLLMLGIFVLMTLRNSIRSLDVRAFALPLVVMLVIRSFLENGLIESSAAFTIFFTVAVLLERGTKEEFDQKRMHDLDSPAPMRRSAREIHVRSSPPPRPTMAPAAMTE